MQEDNRLNEVNSLEYFEVTEDMKPVVQLIAVGDSERLMNQLILKSKQPHILQFTPKDASERFVNKATYLEWLNNGHQIHWLLDEKYNLAGVIWYRNKPMPIKIQLNVNPVETFAIRLYEDYVGHHLSTPFMIKSLKIHIQLKHRDNLNADAIWLETKVENIPAIKSYIKVGYEEVYRDDSKLIMVMSTEKADEIASSNIK